ncbi:conjugative transfer protein MobI(A/C) [Vreelandella aquamarina]|uniref:conjugative transfer protein MobI(A/C) n=1 Tax=Vreelandella aquamarina TaxID=77097 RepID=UPI00384A8421
MVNVACQLRGAARLALSCLGLKGRGLTRILIKSPGPNQYRLSKGEFTKAKNWELAAISAAEDEFEKIRRCCEHLKTVANSIQGFEKIIRANRNV